MVICLERGADCLHMVQLMPLHLKLHHLLPDLNLVSLTVNTTMVQYTMWHTGQLVYYKLNTNKNRQWTNKNHN